VLRETPALEGPAATGIDGISLGGRIALLVGLKNPGNFGAVGGMQPAISERQLPRIATLLKQARKHNPGLSLRLLSSEKDAFLKVTRDLSKLLKSRKEPHRLDIVKGDHSYEFNRGPGVFEMLLYYDRVLRGESP
jgi:enterochelin esterase-like enzyme